MLYTAFDRVETRLLGKVKFTDDDDDANKFSKRLARQLIEEAEGQVELDLSPRYMAPFQLAGAATSPSFAQLPYTSINVLRTLCELQSVLRILETEFGRGSANNADAYKKDIDKRYGDMVKQLLQRYDTGGGPVGQWYYPPLPGLLTSLRNSRDDGIFGAVLVTSRGIGAIPIEQMTDPAQNFLNGTLAARGARDY